MSIGVCACSGAAGEGTSQTEEVVIVSRRRQPRQVVGVLVVQRAARQAAVVAFTAVARGVSPRPPDGPARDGRRREFLHDHGDHGGRRRCSGSRRHDDVSSQLVYVAAQRSCCWRRRVCSVRRALKLISRLHDDAGSMRCRHSPTQSQLVEPASSCKRGIILVAHSVM